MKDKGKLDKRQKKIKQLLEANDRFGVFLGAGSGKTRIVLRHALRIMRRNKRVNMLVVSTKANALTTWPAQLTQQMRLTGTILPFHVMHKEFKQATIPGVNCRFSARIIIVNYEAIRDMLWHWDNDYFDFLVIDESVRVKNWKAKATSVMVAFARQCRYCYPMSGRPSPNKIVDLFSQVYMLDFGARLGKNITEFRNNYMQQGYGNRNIWYTRGYPSESKMRATENEILRKIADICVTEETETFVDDLPTPRYHIERYELSDKQKKKYRKFEKEALLELEREDVNVTAVSTVVLRMKLLQYISGNIYADADEDKPREVVRTSTRRRKAFDKWLKRNYKRGTKLIVVYSFKHSIPDITDALHRHASRQRIIVVDGAKVVPRIMKEWYSGQCDIVVAHAGSIGHGLNLQGKGGQVFFYSLSDNYDHYYQLIRRILRRGNPEKHTDVTVLCCEDTADQLVVDNITAKAELGTRVMSAVSIVKALKRLQQRRTNRGK